MKKPLVSVIVPTKNSEVTIEACLKSIRNQEYQNIEMIVVDNFSDDTTSDIARTYTKKAYSRGPERSPQRNYGVSKASGKYVLIVDSDMVLSEKVVAESVVSLESDTAARGVIIPEESFGEGFWAECRKLERSFYVGIDSIEAARFLSRKDYLDLGGYNRDMISGEDWDFSNRIASLGKINRIESYIYHDEGRPSYVDLVTKKFYYARKFSVYMRKNKGSPALAKQVNVFSRYWLYFSSPEKLFRRPVVGLGMLFMKTSEFAFGSMGLLIALIKQKEPRNARIAK